jgi:hypothetical protein
MNDREMLKEAEDLLCLAEKSADREVVYTRTRLLLQAVRLVAIGIIVSTLLIPLFVPQATWFLIPGLPLIILVLLDTTKFERRVRRKALLNRLARAETTLILWETMSAFCSGPTFKEIELRFRLVEFDVLSPETVRLQLKRLP